MTLTCPQKQGRNESGEEAAVTVRSSGRCVSLQAARLQPREFPSCSEEISAGLLKTPLSWVSGLGGDA